MERNAATYEAASAAAGAAETMIPEKGAAAGDTARMTAATATSAAIRPVVAERTLTAAPCPPLPSAAAAAAASSAAASPDRAAAQAPPTANAAAAAAASRSPGAPADLAGALSRAAVAATAPGVAAAEIGEAVSSARAAAFCSSTSSVLAAGKETLCRAGADTAEACDCMSAVRDETAGETRASETAVDSEEKSDAAALESAESEAAVEDETMNNPAVENTQKGEEKEGMEEEYVPSFFPATRPGFTCRAGAVQQLRAADFCDEHRARHLLSFQRSMKDWGNYDIHGKNAVDDEVAIAFAEALIERNPQTPKEFDDVCRQLRKVMRAAPSKQQILAAYERLTATARRDGGLSRTAAAAKEKKKNQQQEQEEGGKTTQQQGMVQQQQQDGKTDGGKQQQEQQEGPEHRQQQAKIRSKTQSTKQEQQQQNSTQDTQETGLRYAAVRREKQQELLHQERRQGTQHAEALDRSDRDGCGETAVEAAAAPAGWRATGEEEAAEEGEATAAATGVREGLRLLQQQQRQEERLLQGRVVAAAVPADEDLSRARNSSNRMCCETPQGGSCRRLSSPRKVRGKGETGGAAAAVSFANGDETGGPAEDSGREKEAGGRGSSQEAGREQQQQEEGEKEGRQQQRKKEKAGSSLLLEHLLKRKATRTNSGVLVITVLTSPGAFSCPHDCHYCPNEPGQPRSYLSTEPAVLRANQNKWDAVQQFHDRAKTLKNIGHTVDKIEVLVLGGTWSGYPRAYQEEFVRDLFYAANVFDAPQPYRERLSLEEEQKMNETAECRVIGLTLETRPDFINAGELKKLRRFGCTRVQLGIQHVSDEILKYINRGCQRRDAIRAIRLLKNSGFKVDIHIMPDLPGSTADRDLRMLFYLLSSTDLQADQWKLYPCEVTPYSEIEKWYKNGTFRPYAEEEDGRLLVELLLRAKAAVHPWIRLNRVVRDIPNPTIIGGNKVTNLRQVLLSELAERRLCCRCIRCREVKDRVLDVQRLAVLKAREYPTNGGREVFLSFETQDEKVIFGFLRLRLPEDPSPSKRDVPFRCLAGAALLRELHVYGILVAHGEEKRECDARPQHVGLGKRLILAAELIAMTRGFFRMAVIAGVGTREYYRKYGYTLQETYMVKQLCPPGGKAAAETQLYVDALGADSLELLQVDLSAAGRLLMQPLPSARRVSKSNTKRIGRGRGKEEKQGKPFAAAGAVTPSAEDRTAAAARRRQQDSAAEAASRRRGASAAAGDGRRRAEQGKTEDEEKVEEQRQVGGQAEERKGGDEEEEDKVENRRMTKIVAAEEDRRERITTSPTKEEKRVIQQAEVPFVKDGKKDSDYYGGTDERERALADLHRARRDAAATAAVRGVESAEAVQKGQRRGEEGEEEREKESLLTGEERAAKHGVQRRGQDGRSRTLIERQTKTSPRSLQEADMEKEQEQREETEAQNGATEETRFAAAQERETFLLQLRDAAAETQNPSSEKKKQRQQKRNRKEKKAGAETAATDAAAARRDEEDAASFFCLVEEKDGAQKVEKLSVGEAVERARALYNSLRGGGIAAASAGVQTPEAGVLTADKTTSAVYFSGRVNNNDPDHFEEMDTLCLQLLEEVAQTKAAPFSRQEATTTTPAAPPAAAKVETTTGACRSSSTWHSRALGCLQQRWNVVKGKTCVNAGALGALLLCAVALPTLLFLARQTKK